MRSWVRAQQSNLVLLPRLLRASQLRSQYLALPYKTTVGIPLVEAKHTQKSVLVPSAAADCAQTSALPRCVAADGIKTRV